MFSLEVFNLRLLRPKRRGRSFRVFIKRFLLMFLLFAVIIKEEKFLIYTVFVNSVWVLYRRIYIDLYKQQPSVHHNYP